MTPEAEEGIGSESSASPEGQHVMEGTGGGVEVSGVLYFHCSFSGYFLDLLAIFVGGPGR